MEENKDLLFHLHSSGAISTETFDLISHTEANYLGMSSLFTLIR